MVAPWGVQVIMTNGSNGTLQNSEIVKLKLKENPKGCQIVGGAVLAESVIN